MNELLGSIAAISIAITFVLAFAFAMQCATYFYAKICELWRDATRARKTRVTLENAEWNTHKPPHGALIVAHAELHANFSEFPIVGRVQGDNVVYRGGDFPIDNTLLSWIRIPETLTTQDLRGMKDD